MQQLVRVSNIMDHRTTIIAELGVLQKKEANERNIFKARAYGKVISQLKSYDKAIHSVEDLQGLEGIGEKIRTKIQEIIETGKLEAADLVRNDSSQRMMEVLTNIYGIGPVKAKTLLDEHPMKDIADLRSIVSANPGILHEKQHIGLKYYEDFILRIPRKEMEKHEALVVKHACQAHSGLHCDVVGSYRRGAQDSGDIDVLIGYDATIPEADAIKAFEEVVKSLTERGYITDVLAFGPKKFMGVCKLPRHKHARRLDLLLTNAQEYPYALLYFTGSDKYNIKVRKHALTKGYTLNEHGMKPIAPDVPEVPTSLKTEEEVVKFLGLEYVAPNQRV